MGYGSAWQVPMTKPVAKAAGSGGRKGPSKRASANFKKKRKKQRSGMRQGSHFKSEETLALLGTVYDAALAIDTITLKNKKKLTTAKAKFEFLTKAGVSVGKRWAGVPLADVPRPAGKPGPTPLTVDEKFEGFYDWVSAKIEGVKKGGYLTLQIIKTDLQAERGLAVSIRALRRTMKKFGFRYLKRQGTWESRRQEERIQRRLFAFLEWVLASSSRTEVPQAEPDAHAGKGARKRKPEGDGGFYRYHWNTAIAFEDESWVYDCVFRAASWCKTSNKGADKQKKGDGVRVNMLYTIFTHLTPQPMQGNGYHPEALVTWKSTWTGKSHEFAGPTVLSDHILKYFGSRVFPEMGAQGHVLVDGAGNHKEYVDEMLGMQDFELVRLIKDKCEKAEKGSYRAWVWKVFQEQEKKVGALGMEEPQLRTFIRDHYLIDTKLYALAALFHCTLKYLPQYHPEANPVERVWALLKRYYYDTDPTLPHTTRLREALMRIPPDYVDKCIQKSLQWCYQKYAEMKKQSKFGGAIVVVGDAEALDDAVDSGDSDSDSD